MLLNTEFTNMLPLTNDEMVTTILNKINSLIQMLFYTSDTTGLLQFKC